MVSTFFIEVIEPLIAERDMKTLITLLRNMGILKHNLHCGSCLNALTQVDRKESPDSQSFRCLFKSCVNYRSYTSIRKNSFLENFSISLPKFVLFLYLYSIETPCKLITEQTGFSDSTILKLKTKIRNLIAKYYLDNPVLLGGPNIICQIDESKFNFNVRSHRGRGPTTSIWVFGIVDTSFSPAKGYMQIVSDRSANTLLNIIIEKVRPGTCIYSDEWAAYSSLNQMGYMHGTVCHKYNFVSPSTGIHTQNIESYWAKQKLRIKKAKGVKGSILPSILNEFMYFDEKKKNVFLALVELISLN